MGPLVVGDIQIYWLQGGEFRLDGGTMFGPVPKALWMKKYPVADDNTIMMVNDPLLVKKPSHCLLIDSGLGNRLTQKSHEIYQIGERWDVVGGLHDLGIEPTQIDFVILTHGDFDHAGGAIWQNPGGQPELLAPNAKYILQKREWEAIVAPHLRAKATYFWENFSLFEPGVNLLLADGDLELCPGVRVRLTGGHTCGHQLVEIRSQGETAVHLGDLFPTNAHSNPLWVMAYDDYPLEVINRKSEYFQEYIKKNSWFTSYHDPQVRACRLDSKYKILERWPE
jgi:glyoxylase-like metal-dependent hydrolase (beta-lactamase superfamily II)